MNTDTTWLSFQTFIGHPQVIQSRKMIMLAVVYDKIWQTFHPPDANVIS